MAELLDREGVWSEDLIMLTLDTLAEIEADEMQRHQASVSAAIAGAFQKGGADKFHQVLDLVKRESREARRSGTIEESPKKSFAKEMLGLFGAMGMAVPKPRAKR